MMDQKFYQQIVGKASLGYAYHKIILDEKGSPIDYEFLDVNENFENLTGLKKEQLVNQRVSKVMPDLVTDAFDWIAFYGEVALTGQEREFEQYSEELNKYYHTKAYSPQKNYFVTLFTDISHQMHITNISKHFIEDSGSEIDYQKITEDMVMLSGAKYVAFNLFDKDACVFKTLAITGIQKDIKKALDIIKMNVIGKEWEYNPIKEEKIDGKVVAYFDSLHQLVGNMIPDKLIRLVEVMFNLGEAVVVQITKEGYVQGEFILMMPKGRPLKSQEIVKIYASQVALYVEKQKNEARLRQSQKKYKDLASQVHIGIVSCNLDGTIIFVNTRMLEILGSPSIEETKKINMHTFLPLIKQGIPKYIKESIQQDKIVTAEISYVSKWNKKLWLRVHVKPQKEDGKIIGTRIIVDDITESKKLQERIEYLSYHDQLTGLYNRRYYDETLDKINNEGCLPLSVVMIDVNGLKLFNDAFGHFVGDQLLQHVANILKTHCQPQDIIARVGGDEFIILLPLTNAQQVDQRVKEIKNQVNRETIKDLHLSVSFGWSTMYHAVQNIQTVIKEAEEYMYKNKLSESASMRNKSISMIMKTLYEKNEREEIHSKRVSQLCYQIGSALNLNEDKKNELRLAGLMHDIGKIVIDSMILDKKGKLTEEQWHEIKKHPEVGYQILRSVDEYATLATYVLAHHERWNGTGYPKGLKKEEIPYESRIIAIADTFDAMTNDRPYRKGLSKEIAIGEIKDKSGIQFDPQMVDAFIEYVDNI